MGKRAIRVFVFALVMVLPLWGMELGSGAGVHRGGRPAHAPGELLVKYKPALRAPAADYARQRWGVSTLRTFRDIGVHQVKLPPDMAVEEGLELYHSDPEVEYVEPNYYRYITATTPNDTDYGLLWGLNDIDAPEAWDIATACTGKVVAIIDTGADFNHPDLAGNIATGGHDFVDNDDAPMDPNGHGTHVAGTIAAVGNNARGVTGICWSGQPLMILRAFDAFGSATLGDIISAMEYARTNNANVINASYAGADFSQTERDEISSLNTAGILFVAAAGNEGANNDSTPSYPASYNLPNIIAVAATDQSDNLASFSNYGRSSVDVAAPGTNVYSTKPGRQTVFSDDFDDHDITDWTVEAPWGLSTTYAASGNYSLADSPGGNYGNNVNTSARPANAINLSGQSGTTLTFKIRGSIRSGDALYVETATDATAGPWTPRPVLVNDEALFENGIFGTLSTWADATVDLGNLDGAATAYFRFRLQTNGSGTADGVYIDDVMLSTAEAQDTYQFLNGTSMSTPHVSGLAALIWSNNSGLSASEVRARIFNCVDRLTDLSQKVVTWGRINAFNSLRNLPAPPVGLSARAASNTQINLSWANTYLDPIGFKIERSEGTSGVFTEIADLGSNAVSYSDTGLTRSTTYTYRMRAYSSDNVSEYSAEVTATAEAPSSGGGGSGGGVCFIAASQKE